MPILITYPTTLLVAWNRTTDLPEVLRTWPRTAPSDKELIDAITKHTKTHYSFLTLEGKEVSIEE